MRRLQIVILWLGIIAIVGMCLVPPWTVRVYRDRPLRRGVGYHLLFSPPDSPDHPHYDSKYRGWDWRVDTTRLAIQCIGVAIVAAGLIATVRYGRSRP